jgi:hypothetical protein
MKIFALCAALGLASLVTSCVSYSGVSKAQSGELYISGATSYFVFSQPWIRKCDVDGQKLNCVELSETPQPPPGQYNNGGATATPPSATTDAPAGAAPPAPEAAGAKKK